MNTKITELLGIKYPIFQGSMANISDGRFAAAVSNAGGLGIISGGGKTAEEIRKEVTIAKELTQNPFAVNIVLQPKEMVDGIIDMLIRENIRIVTTSAGSPKAWIPKMKAAGMTVISVIASPRQAAKAEAAGVDAVVAEGSESGGHIGDAHTMPLIPAVVSAVQIPVIAAGGIADGRGLAAALMLGAEGIQMGTAFITTEECPVSDVYKEQIINAQVTDTIVTGVIAHDVVRSLKSPLSLKMAEIELRDGDPQELIALGTGSLRRAVAGDWETGSFQVGQSVGLIRKTASCRDLIKTVMAEAEQALRRAGAFL